MPRNIFVEIHTLTSYSSVLLNRDDFGSPKTGFFGGKERTRISSQCQKYAWRQYLQDQGFDISVRSREIFKSIADDIIASNPSLDKVAVISAVVACKKALLAQKDKDSKVQQDFEKKLKAVQSANADLQVIINELEQSDENTVDKEVLKKINNLKKDKIKKQKSYNSKLETLREYAEKNDITFNDKDILSDADVDYSTTASLKDNEIFVIGKNEIDAIKNLATEIAGKQTDDEKKEILKNIKSFEKLTLNDRTAVDIALSGRMIAGAPDSRVDSSMSVAHAITTHEHEEFSDYFTAVDSLNPNGSAHINSQALTSGVFYGYAVVEMAKLFSNLSGKKESDFINSNLDLESEVIAKLIEAMCFITPGAKKGSTAPYGTNHMLVVQISDKQPQNLVTAFEKPTEKTTSSAEDAFRTFLQQNYNHNGFSKKTYATFNGMDSTKIISQVKSDIINKSI
ncbi:MAG: hypothetical protein HC836_40445 [Richelia sp. RM2_1_2]|nr:hypothetical protein [Richelia sp. RM2_1_2]